MSKIIWDETGKRTYETGVSQGVLYPIQRDGTYSLGVPWNGLTAVTESPSGAEASPMYADNIKYLNLISAEEFGGTVEAYTYPDEFAECDGSIEIQPGVSIGQQDRKMFGMSYKTVLGNDSENNNHGYKLHVIYGAMAAPSEKGYNTINDSPEAITFSWEISTTPVSVKGFKPTATVTINSTKVDKEKLAKLEEILYGTDSTNARLPLPDEIAAIMKDGAPEALSVTSTPADSANDVAITSHITLTFNNKITSENVVMTSANGNAIEITKSLDETGKILTVTPKAQLSNSTMYMINLVGIKDIYNQYLAFKVIKFTTVSA